MKSCVFREVLKEEDSSLFPNMYTYGVFVYGAILLEAYIAGDISFFVSIYGPTSLFPRNRPVSVSHNVFTHVRVCVRESGLRVGEGLRCQSL